MKMFALRFCLAILLLPTLAGAATITVNSTSDPAGFNANITIAQLGATVTLRDAVNAVRNTGGTHTITFASALAGQTIYLSQVAGDAGAALVLSAPDAPLPNNLTIQGLTGNNGVTIARAANAQQMGLLICIGATSSLTMNDLTFKNGSQPTGYGGALNIVTASVVNLNRCTFSDNTAQVFGGAIFVRDGQVNLTNCTLAGNVAYNQGGGIYHLGGTLTLTHTTITDNTSNGGGLFTHPGGPLLVNTIVAGNHKFASEPDIGTDGTPVASSSHHNLIGDAASAGGLSNGVNSNIVGVSPLLNSLAYNGGPTATVALSASSPALNAASAGVVNVDQRGIARPQGGGADIGAYELVNGAPTTFASANNTTFVIGYNNSFNVTANGAPSPTYSQSGTLPAGVSFTAAGLLSGNPSVGTEGTYSLIITASNSAGTTTQAFTLTVIRAVIVTTATDEDNGSTDPALGSGTSLREAVNYANTQSNPQTIVFAPSLAGQSIDLSLTGDNSVGPSALRINANITIQGPTGNSGIVIRRGISGSLRPFLVSLGATLTLNDLTVADGKASFGGAVFNLGTLRMSRCTLRNNTADSFGGAIYSGGGGSGQTLSLTNCTLAQNSAGFGGGAIRNDDSSSATLTNVTVAGNMTTATGVSDTGGGVYTDGPLLLINSIIAQNTEHGTAAPSDLRASTTSGSHHNLIGTAGSSGLVNGVNGNIVGVPNPGLASLAANGGPTQTVALLDSPAIDAGATVSGVTTDQRGVSRPQGPAPDIGAYEGDFTGAPTVNSPFFDSVTASSAHLGGQVASDSGFPITRRGVVYAPTSVNPNPRLGGTGVLTNDDPVNTTGGFTRTVTGLNSSTNYSFAAFAVNSRGTGYSQTTTFLTNPPAGSGSLVVTTTVDEDNGTSDPGMGSGTSLREAIAYANALGGDRTITFSSNLFASGPATITLSQALGTVYFANLSGTTTIAGPGASQLIISGNNSIRIFQMDEGSARLNGCTLTKGNTFSNGAVLRSYGTIYANECVFASNTSSGQGGAIYNGGAGYFARCTFSNNSASSYGGAIANEGTLWAINCTFSGNSASNGGAIANLYSSSTVRLICSTVANNSATTAGGGLLINNVNMTVNNTIVSGNTAPSGPNISGTPSSSGLTSDLIDADPAAIFATGILTNNGGPTPTIALKPGGPAVNTGTNSLAVDNNFVALTTDQRGSARVTGGVVDIGAYETLLLPTLGASTVTNVGANSATLGGNVTSDGYGAITKRGILYAPTSQNSNPTLGGASVIEVDVSGTTGVFTTNVSGLSALTGYSFTTFATNEVGTVYAPVQTFTTTETQSLTVTILTDTSNASDGQTSLREALTYAATLPSATINIAASLAGQTITLNSGWNNAADDTALRVTGQVNLVGPTNSPGVTIAISSGVQKRHIQVESGGNLQVSNLTFTGGSGDFGGALRSLGTLGIHNCTFVGNSATQDGGAVHAGAGSASLVIENSTFSGNSTNTTASAVASGALQNTYRYLTITNNSGGSGAIDIYQNPATMIDSIVAGNSPDGIVQLNGGAFSAQSTNNILGSGGSGGLTNGSNGNQIGLTSAQLYLGSLGNNGGPTPTVPLLPGSPAIDAGVAIAGLTSDQRGTTRPQANAPDIGAFELVWTQAAAAIPIVSPLGGTYEGSAQITITSVSSPTSVRYTLDGSTPSSTNGQIYSAPFTLTQSATVKAIAYGRGWLNSPIATVAYTVLPPLSYWRNLQGLAADGSQDLANPSGDGIANILKYAFNLAPNGGDLMNANYRILPSGGTAGLPLITRDDQGRLVIEFVRRKASTNPGITYIVETGDDLNLWNPVSLTNADVTSIDTTWERVSVIDPTATPARFGRVRVTY